MVLGVKVDVPVCPHADGVGRCDYVQQRVMFDDIGTCGSWTAP